jgi:hypothetical protein
MPRACSVSCSPVAQKAPLPGLCTASSPCAGVVCEWESQGAALRGLLLLAGPSLAPINPTRICLDGWQHRRCPCMALS